MATADNLKIAQQLLATMQQVTVQVERQTEAYNAQSKLVEAICKAQECFSKIDPSKVKEITDGLREAQEQTKEFGTQIEEAQEKMGMFGAGLKKVTNAMKKLVPPLEFLNGFKSGITLSTSLFKNIMGLGKTSLGILAEVGEMILSLPGRLLDFFQGAAGGGMDPYKAALEELREEFGNLKIGTSKAVKSMTEDMRGFTSANIGVSFNRVFGFGREGLAKLLTENMELFKAMGPIARQFAKDIKGSELDFTVLRKAANLGAEAFKSMQLTAQDAGQNTGQAIKALTRDMARAERAFNVSSKEMGKDLDFMMKETASFGILAPQTMLKTSIYARKLGITMEALKGIMEKTLHFEDAANQAAKLSEAFNIQIDAMKLMNEQDPTKKMDLYRQAFFKTGQNIEHMTIAQKKYMSEQTGMTEDTMRLAFAQKNRALSGEQLDAQMKKAQKTQISQVEAMKQLAESIKRLVPAGEAMKGSFLDIFMKGFERGIRRTREFRGVVRSLQQSLKVVYWAGAEVGRLFVKEFPGIKDMLQALKSMFNPAHFRGLMSKVVDEFRSFFKLLHTDPKAGVEQFMKNMKKIFFDFFDSNTPAGRKFLEGLKNFYHAIFVIVVAGIKHGLEALRDVTKMIVDAIKNPQALEQMAGGLGGDLLDSFSGMLLYLKTELKPVFIEAASGLWELVKLMFKTLYENFIKPNLGTILLAYFAPAIIGGLLRGGGALIFSALGSYLSRVIRGSNEIAEGMTRTIRRTTTDAEGRQVVTERTINQQAKETEGIGRGLLKMAGALAVMIAAVGVTIEMLIKLAGVYQRSGLKPEDMIVVGLMFAGITLLLVTVMKLGFFKALQEASAVPWGAALKGITILGATLLAIGGVTALIIKMFSWGASGAKPEFILAVAVTMAAMTMLFLAAIPVLAAATLVGTAVGGTGIIGLIGAGAGTLGMGIIGATLVAIAETSVAVIQKFRGIRPEEATVATQSMKAMTELYRVIGGMLASLLSYAKSTGRAREATQIVTALTGLVTQVAESAKGILDKIDTAGPIETMKAKAELLNSVLGGMASIISPLAEFSKVYAGHIGELDPEVFNSFGNAIGKIMDKLGGAINSIIGSLQRMMQGVSNIEVIKASGAALASILTAVAALISLIMQMFPDDSGSTVMTVGGGLAAGASIGGVIGTFIFPGVGTGVGMAIGAVIGAGIAYFSHAGAFSQRVDAMKGMFDTIVNKMNGLVTGITGPLQNLLGLQDKTETGIKAAAAIGPIFQTIASVLGVVATLTEGFKAENMNTSRINALGTQITNIIGSVQLAIDKMITSLPGLLTSLASIPISRNLGSKVRALQGVFDLIKSIAGVISSLIVTVGPASAGVTRQLGPVGEIFEPILRVLACFVLPFSQSIPGMEIIGLRELFEQVLNGLGTIHFPPNLSAKVTQLKSVFETIKTVAEAAKSLKDLGGTGAQPFETYPLDVPLSNLARIIAGLGSDYTSQGWTNPLMNKHHELDRIGPIYNNIRGMGTKFTGIKDSLTEMMTTATAISELGQGTSSTTAPTSSSAELPIIVNLRRMFDHGQLIDQLAGYFTDQGTAHNFTTISQTVSQIKNNLTGRITSNITAMVASYNTFSRELATLGSDAAPLQVTLDALGTRLGGVQTAHIENAAVNATINVSVVMHAGDVVQALRTHSSQVNSANHTKPIAFNHNAFNNPAPEPNG